MPSKDLKSLVIPTGVYNGRDLPDNELNTALLSQISVYLHSIRSMLVFLTIVAAVSLLFGLAAVFIWCLS